MDFEVLHSYRDGITWNIEKGAIETAPLIIYSISVFIQKLFYSLYSAFAFLFASILILIRLMIAKK
jgi:hypothetical protein